MRDAPGQLGGDVADVSLAADGDAEEDDDEGQREPVVDAGLDVEQVTEPAGDLVVADDSRREDRVGRGEDGSDEEALDPAERR